jgi:hypothetical protein
LRGDGEKKSIKELIGKKKERKRKEGGGNRTKTPKTFVLVA